MDARGSAPDEVAIALTVDDTYVPHFAACVASLAASRGTEAVRIHLLQGPTLSAQNVDRLHDFVGELGLALDVIPITDEMSAAVPSTRFYPPLVWYRLLVPELLSHVDRVIVLDADVLVLQSLWPLFKTDLGTNLLAAVGTSTALVGAQDDERLLSLGLDLSQPYLNTGVMVMNLDAMRAEAVGPRALAFGRQRGQALLFPEQDSLNVAAKDQWELLHPRWNAMSHLFLDIGIDDDTYDHLDVQSARQSPSIVHFEGHSTVKPWHFRSVHPLRFLYRDFRNTTPWPLDALEGRSLTGAALRRLPLRSQYAISRAKRRLVALAPGH